MFFKQLLLPALLVASINAHPSLRAGPHVCGTPDPTEQQINASKSLLELERSSLRLMGERKLKVDTYFHIIASSGSEEDGNVTANGQKQKKVDDQLAKITDAFAPHGISFNLLNVTRTINASWANVPITLNVYFVKSIDDFFSNATITGYGIMPDMWDQVPDPHLDGCVARASTMPGGSLPAHDQGETLVHEIGHWFNLYHPFHGGCEGVGDLIDDTPAQADTSQKHECIVGLDTCPESKGTDPIHNYMGYTDDACRNEFTKGQEDRIYSSWEKYRRPSTH